MSSERDAFIKLVDLALTYNAATTRIHEIIDRARSEGRTVTMEEVDALSVDTEKRRARWDEITK
jgi:hypothetical protein